MDNQTTEDVTARVMRSPTLHLNLNLSTSSSPSMAHLISRKNRFIHTPNGTYDGGEGDRGRRGIQRTLVSTPVATSTVKRMRRDDVRANPFEKHLLDQLHASAWSPSVFSENATSETPPDCNWSVEQISMLNPSQIEDSPSTHQDEEMLTPQTEAKAQRAISMFFSQSIVPSPSPKIEAIENEVGTNDTTTKSTTPDNDIIDGNNTSYSNILNASLRRRKLNFTLSPNATDESMEVNDLSLSQGELLPSPGIDAVDTMSPRRFREGLESPNVTPIRIPHED